MSQLPPPAWAEPFLRGQGRLLERLAAGAPLKQIMEELCLLVEAHCPGKTCAILLVGEDDRFRIAGAPSLPEPFWTGVEGSGLGPGTTPCGLAASLGREVLVADLQSDPAWERSAPLSTALSVRGCVSIPILGGEGKALGTFALYQPEAGPFPEQEIELLRASVGLASIAIRHHQRETQADELRERQALAKSEGRFQAMVSALEELVLEFDRQGRFLEVWTADESLLAYPRSELLGKSVEEVLPPEFAQRVKASILRVLETGQPEDLEYSLQVRKGERWFLARLTAIREGNTSPDRVCVLIRDITQRKEAEDALRASESRFRILCEHVGQLVYDRNLDADTIEWTGPIERLIGVPPEAFQTEGVAGWARRIHPVDRDEVLAHVDRSRTHLQPFSSVYRFRKADGTYLHIEDRGAFVSIRGHSRMVGVMTDITADTQAEARYRELVEALAEGIAIVGGDETFEFANPAAHAVFGVEPDTLPGRLLTEFLYPDQLDILHAQTRRRQEGRQSTYELQIHRPSGEVRTLAVNASPRIREEGSYAGAFVVFLDITERVEAEAALRRSENRFRRLFEAIPMGVVIHREGHIQYVNPATAQAVGLASAEEAVGRKIADFLLPEDLQTTMQRLEVLRAGGEVPWIEMRHLRIDGSAFPVESRMMILEAETQPVLLSVFQDISDRKRTEESLRQTQKLESLGVLAGGIAHDFNNLLTAMLGNLNLAQMSMPNGAPAAAYLDHLEGAIQKAAELTRQMLAYSGRGRFIVHPINLNLVVEEMAKLLAVSIPKKISLRFHLQANLPLVEADMAQLQQVVMNLVLNASESIGESEGLIAISTSALTLDQNILNQEFMGQDLEPGPHVLLEITDTGSGMSPEVAGKIFDPFFSTKSTGRGLGLSAMLGILRGHQAGIRLQTALNQGSTFSIYFPASEASDPGPSVQATESRTTPNQGCLLLVDDEESLRSTLGAMLRGLGYEVLEASDGAEALEVFQRHRASLCGMVLDLTMPRMDGRETLRQLRTFAPDFPVLLNSGYDEGDALVSLLSLGPAAFIQKPYSIGALQAALDHLLGKE